MSDRPPDGPEFGWLYGSKDGPAADDPEPTRMIPTTPRPEAGPTKARSAAQPAPPNRPPPLIAPNPGSGRRRRPPVVRIILLVLLLWVAFLVIVPIVSWSKVDKVAAFPSGSRPAEQPGTTYLLVGSDSRAGLTAKQRRQLTTGSAADAPGGRTDTILLLHTGSGPSLLLSIPRDSLVPIPGHGTTKINAAFAYGGPKLLVKTIEQDTGVRLDDYVEIGFGGFVNSVDAVGGITICPKRRLDDKDSGLHVKKGCQTADGITALAYSRDRHSFALGDLTRAQHQREVINATGSKIKSPWTILNPFRYVGVVHAATSSLKVSKGTSLIAMARFGMAMSKVNGKSGLTCSMPISDLAVHWDHTRALELLKYIKEDRTGDLPKHLCTTTGLPG
jgi:LCP family protein required for cell wall assembly